MTFVQSLIQLLPTSPFSVAHTLTSGKYFYHAVATPLTQIALNLESILETVKTKPDLELESRTLYQTLLQTHHLESVLKSTQIQSLKHKNSFKIKSALEEVIIRLNQPRRGRHLKVALQLDEQTQLAGHVFYFQEALSCLLNNAFEAYTKNQRHRTITVLALQHAKYLQLYICDQGQGMNWLTQKLVTLEGFTKKSAGHGLGLSFTKKIIEEYFKGKFVLSSYVGVGTIAMIQLPLKARVYTHNHERF